MVAELVDITYILRGEMRVPESYRYHFHRPAVNVDKLRVELDGIPGIVGVQFNPPSSLSLITLNELTEAQSSQIDSIVGSHQATPTPAQVQEQEREQARQTALAAVRGNLTDAILQAIASDQTDIAADAQTITGLSGVLTIATLRPLLLRILARQNRILNRVELMVKVVSRE